MTSSGAKVNEVVTEGARYSHFAAILDCEVCGNELRIEQDVSNGEVLECESCGSRVEVYGR